MDLRQLLCLESELQRDTYFFFYSEPKRGLPTLEKCNVA